MVCCYKISNPLAFIKRRWRPLEAVLGATGSQAEVILECLDDELQSGRPKPIDIEYLLAEVIPSILLLTRKSVLACTGSYNFLFLQSTSSCKVAGSSSRVSLQSCFRLSWLGSIWRLPFRSSKPPMLESPSKSLPLRQFRSAPLFISRRGVLIYMSYSFCLGIDDATLTPFMPRVAKDLGPFLLLTSEDTLSLVLETLSMVVVTDGSRWLSLDLASSLVHAVLEVWTKNNKGAFFLSAHRA